MRQVYSQDASDLQILDGARYEIDKLVDSVKLRLGEPEKKNGNCTAALGKATLVDPTSGAISVTLPKLSAITVGSIVTIKNNSTSTNTITIYSSGADTIDTASSTTITTASGAKMLMALSDSEWGEI